MRYKFLKQKAVVMIYLVISLIFVLTSLQPVMAEEVSENACCEKTESGGSCIYTDIASCDNNYEVRSMQRCEDTEICKIGCCVNEDEGICSRMTSKASCEAEGYSWFPGEECDINQCEKGCCVLATASCAYVTEARCDKIMETFPELEKDFRSADSEIECTGICRQMDTGCCVKDDDCKWTTRASCGLGEGLGGDGFYKDKFCSDEALPCDCEPESSKGCVEGKESVYWFDSCGNPEEIAEECSYSKESSLCAKADDEHEEAYCKSLHCESTWSDDANSNLGGFRTNGETWCSYDAKVTTVFDVVGSRHFRHICINGIEVVEPCKDYREEYCIYGDIYNEDIGSNMQVAGCKANRWESCIEECNSAKDAETTSEYELAIILDKECCERSDVRDCVWAGDETQGMCMPLVAPGMKFWSDDSAEVTPPASAEEFCEKGSNEIEVIFGKMKGELKEEDWDCKQNCEAMTEEYLKTQNELCRSYGDCGAHYNYIGGFSDKGFYRTPLNIFGRDLVPFLDEELVGDFQQEWLTDVEGIYMGVLDIGGWDKWGSDGKWSNTAAGFALIGVSAMITTAFSFVLGYSSAAVAFSAAAATTGGFMTGIAAGAEAAAATLTMAAAASWIVGIGAVILVAVILYTALTWPETTTEPVSTYCQPWQPLAGGDDCHICDEDPMRPCSEYRCRSLGSQCRFISENEGTGYESCVAVMSDDISAPKIEWDEEVFKVVSQREEVTSTIKTSSTNNGHKLDKIPAHSKITFGIETDEPAQCYLSTEFKDPLIFSDLKQPFGNTNYKQHHNITYNNLAPNEEHKFYISCRDYNDNPKLDEYIVPYIIEFETDDAPDLSAPYIVTTMVPEQGKVQSHVNETNIAIYVEDSSEFDCRYSNEDQSFDLMQNEMSCTTPSANSLFSSYELCAAEYNVTEDKNTVYVRCKDENGNENNEGYIINVDKTDPLNIVTSGPSGDIYEKDITMYIETIGGSDNGRAVCSYISNLGTGQFGNTNSSNSKNVFVDMMPGNYNFDVTCIDDIGNKDEVVINFSSTRDLDPPQILDLYKSGQTIYLELNEAATCQYKNESFSYGEGTVTSINVRKHLFSGKKKYHIICQDIFENQMPEIVVYLELPKIVKQNVVGSEEES